MLPPAWSLARAGGEKDHWRGRTSAAPAGAPHPCLALASCKSREGRTGRQGCGPGPAREGGMPGPVSGPGRAHTGPGPENTSSPPEHDPRVSTGPARKCLPCGSSECARSVCAVSVCTVCARAVSVCAASVCSECAHSDYVCTVCVVSVRVSLNLAEHSFQPSSSRFPPEEQLRSFLLQPETGFPHLPPASALPAAHGPPPEETLCHHTFLSH